MDISGIRLANYKRLLQEFQDSPGQAGLMRHGLIKRFADHAGLSDRYLSHVNNGKKNIGEVIARKMEAGFGKDHGWLDNNHEVVLQSGSDTEKEFIAIVMDLYRESPVEMNQHVMRFAVDRIRGKKK